MTIDLDRHVSFDALFNVRDLGGYATADGRHTRWRSCTGPTASTGSRATISAVGRPGPAHRGRPAHPNERVERGSFPVESMPVDYHHFPVLQQTWEGQTLDATIDGAEFLTARYREMLVVGAEAIVGAVRGC